MPKKQKYCSQCRGCVPQDQTMCNKRSCIDKKAELCWFNHIQIKDQLKLLYDGNKCWFNTMMCLPFVLFNYIECWELLQYPQNRQVDSCRIQDIQDGSKYVEMSKPGRFFSYPEHTGLILNTDGVAAFKSSKHSIWPIYRAVTSLPPHLSMRKYYVLLAAVWFGLVSFPDSALLFFNWFGRWGVWWIERTFLYAISDGMQLATATSAFRTG